jgi:hypothetical protein
MNNPSKHDRIAVLFENDTLIYRELDDRSSRPAFPIYINRNLAMIIGPSPQYQDPENSKPENHPMPQ